MFFSLYNSSNYFRLLVLTYKLAPDESASDINFSSDKFSIFFDKISITLCNKGIESFTNSNVISKLVTNMKKRQFRENLGTIDSFIPDNNTCSKNDVLVANFF